MILETVPHVKVDADWQRQPEFFVESRTPHMAQSDCGKCHTPNVKPILDAVLNAHADIDLVHGRTGQLACGTCHTKDQPQTLIAGATKKTSFDHAYNLCSTCHFQQAKDWQNGAHGKRLAGWAGPRVIRNCTGCHNPHNPRIPSAYPVAQPRIIRKGLEGHNHE